MVFREVEISIQEGKLVVSCKNLFRLAHMYSRRNRTVKLLGWGAREGEQQLLPRNNHGCHFRFWRVF